MGLANLFKRLNPRTRRNEQAKAELKANAEKALRMKQEAASDRHVPPHQTAHDGMHPKPADATEAQGAFTPELKRSRVARSGDAS